MLRSVWSCTQRYLALRRGVNRLRRISEAAVRSVHGSDSRRTSKADFGGVPPGNYQRHERTAPCHPSVEQNTALQGFGRSPVSGSTHNPLTHVARAQEGGCAEGADRSRAHTLDPRPTYPPLLRLRMCNGRPRHPSKRAASRSFVPHAQGEIPLAKSCFARTWWRVPRQRSP